MFRFSKAAFQISSPSYKKKTHSKTDVKAPNLPLSIPATPTDDAFDLTTLENNILKALEHLTHKLGELRSGGRFKTDTLEKLKVKLKSGETLLVGDLAQVVVKGRFVNVILSDEEV
jgi:ribosome recycling factor